MVTAAERRKALVEGRGGVVEQLRRAALDLRRLGTLGAERRSSGRAVGGQHFIGGLAGQVGEVERLRALRGSRVGREAGDVGGQVPALAVVQLVGEGRHVRAFDPQAQRVVDRIEAQAVQALRVLQVRWRRRHADARRAITGAGRAVADRAVLGIQWCAAGRVGRNRRGLADFIRRRQLGAQLPGLAGHAGTILTSGHGRDQFIDPFDQFRALGLGRQLSHQALQYPQKFHLLTVFRFIDDLARRYRRRIVRADVVQQMQGFRGALGRRGQQIEAARHQRRQ